ncbi:TPA: ornithine acetyltransferase, partial [Candidatus Sumerlaeota bacterium]|nr:ornithine acetyltransferase [Candidatus Sumerlaeota bacterium]
MKKNDAVSVAIPGFTLGAVSAGLKTNNALDLCLILSDSPCTAAGVFTRNRVVGEPVKLDRLHLRHATHRAIVVNSKIANVCTGPEGYANAKAMAAGVAAQVGCDPREVFVASTGIIGRQLPIEKVLAGIEKVFSKCQTEGWEEASRAIMTTDTYPKLRTREFVLGGKPVKMAAMAKGSGMIQPNMATMLSFIGTDAAIPKD